jgi:zinc protease
VQHSHKRVAHPQLDVERIVLPNGLILLLSENHSTPSVSINGIVLAGSRFESDDKAGLASLTGALLDSGTTTRTSQQIAETVEAVGGHLATFGDYQSSGVVVTLLSRDTQLGLEIASDLLLNSTFPDDKVLQEIARRVAQLKSRLDEPRIQASDVFNEIVFGAAPLHRPSVGYDRTVNALTRADIERFYRRFYVPNNTIIAIVGDIDRVEIKARVASLFGNWERSEFESPTVIKPERQTAPITRFVTVPKEQVNIFIGHVGIARGNSDFYSLLVMDTILGSSPGFTSRIPRVLRDEQGLAYSTFSTITSSATLDPGRFIAFIGTAPANLGRALAGLRSEIQRIVDEPVTAEELEVAKLYLTGSFVFRFQKNAQIADFLIDAEVYGLGFDYLERYPELIRAVTIEEISRVAGKYIHPMSLTTVAVGPLDQTGNVIRKQGDR